MLTPMNPYQQSIHNYEVSTSDPGKFDVINIFEIPKIENEKITIDLETITSSLVSKHCILKATIEGNSFQIQDDKELAGQNFYLKKSLTDEDSFRLLSSNPLAYKEGELFRIGEIVTPTSNYVYFQAHHIILDGGGQKIIAQDLTDLIKGRRLRDLCEADGITSNNEFIQKRISLFEKRKGFQEYVRLLKGVENKLSTAKGEGYCFTYLGSVDTDISFDNCFNVFANMFLNVTSREKSIVKIVADLRSFLPAKKCLGNYVNTLPIVIAKGQRNSDVVKSKMIYAFTEFMNHVDISNDVTFNYYKTEHFKKEDFRELVPMNFSPRNNAVFSIDISSESVMITLRGKEGNLPREVASQIINKFLEKLNITDGSLKVYEHYETEDLSTHEELDPSEVTDGLVKTYNLVSQGKKFTELSSIKRVLVSSLFQKHLKKQFNLSYFMLWGGEFETLNRYIKVVSNDSVPVFLFPDFSGEASSFHESFIKLFENHRIHFQEYQENLNIEQQANRVFNNIKDKKKVILIGYSFGGLVAFEVAKLLEIAKVGYELILIDSRVLKSIPSDIEMSLKLACEEVGLKSMKCNHIIAENSLRSYLSYSLSGQISKAIYFKSTIDIDDGKNQTSWREHIEEVIEVNLSENHASIVGSNLLKSIVKRNLLYWGQDVSE